MELSQDTFVREWSLKWAEGVVIGFARDRLDRPRAFGMLRTALRKLGVKEEELTAILRAIETSPIYLPSMTSQQKAAKLNPIWEAIERKEI